MAGLLALVMLAAGWQQLSVRAQAAASYGARIGCSCHYASGRNLSDCRKDFEPGMGLVWLSEDAAAHTVTAHFPLFASQSASWHEGEGCVLERWRGGSGD